ncbi:MAG TPA: response regulator [Blastocatellia bacterium]|nr:response regulator [Blastocatellia bacterium]
MAFATAPLVTVVDDDEAIREALESLLKSAGFRAAVFGSAEGFLASGHLDEISCLILDVRMPGMSGFELQERLVAADNRIPIIFITAHADEAARARAGASGAIAFLSKPFAEEALLEAVRATTEPDTGDSSELS